MKLSHDGFGKLVLTLPGGQSFTGVTPVRCFPLNHPEGDVAFLDAHGSEVHYLASLDALEAPVREFLAAELRDREFLPKILRVLDISDGAEPTTWKVETDAGSREFELTSEDRISRLGDAAIITDASGIRYRLVSIAALDKRSRRVLNRYL